MLRFFFQIFCLTLCSFAFAARGDIISSELLETYNLNNNQAFIDNELSQIVSDQFSLDPVEYGVSLYKIIYETINANGEIHHASGVFAYPRVDYPLIPNQAFPILSYQHGTAIEKSSVTSENGLWVLPAVIAGSGFVYIEPDYLGLGVSNCRHPYQLKEPYATDIVDLLRAVKHFAQDNSAFETNDQLYLAGYSEGGYATMAAHEIIERDYYDEFVITASFPMAGAYSMSEVMANVMLSFESYGEPFYFPYVLFSYIDYYPILSMPNEYLLPEYHHLYDMFDGYHSSSEINNELPSIPITIMKPDSIASFEENPAHPLREALSLNDNWNWNPIAPIYLFHGEGDELVPIENSEIAYNQFLSNGSEEVYLEVIPASWGGHSEVAPFALLGAFQVANEMQIINDLGDLNQDGMLDISDIILISNLVIHNNFSNYYELWSSDINIDNSQDILDVIILIKKIIS